VVHKLKRHCCQCLCFLIMIALSWILAARFRLPAADLDIPRLQIRSQHIEIIIIFTLFH